MSFRTEYEINKSKFLLWKEHARPGVKIALVCIIPLIIIALICMLLWM